MTEPTQLSQAQLRALFSKKRGITLQAKGTSQIDNKRSRSSEDFDIEKVMVKGKSGTSESDVFLVREKGSERGVLTTRKEMKNTMNRFRQERKRFPPNQELNRL